MREKLNENPLYQAAAIGVLLVVAAIFLLGSMGGEEEEASSESGESLTAQAVAEAEPAGVPPPGALAESAPPPPAPVQKAFDENRTVVLLFVRKGGFDDRIVKSDIKVLKRLEPPGYPDPATFVVPADKIARYATIAQGAGVTRVPALVVIRPKKLDHGIPTASVREGVQSLESVYQAVRDAGYKGRVLAYHP
jgi:hypothetical protein